MTNKNGAELNSALTILEWRDARKMRSLSVTHRWSGFHCMYVNSKASRASFSFVKISWDHFELVISFSPVCNTFFPAIIQVIMQWWKLNLKTSTDIYKKRLALALFISKLKENKNPYIQIIFWASRFDHHLVLKSKLLFLNWLE